MHITRIELENIKSYEHAVFEFERGTTAIMGENGAGKTTIIETVAWTLFDLLDYKKDDFLRRGAKKGSAIVEFESGLDERRYIVHRDTRTAYFVYDPQLKTRIADKKEEVTRFLWQHLGVEAGTDLETLFRRAIGVPQGTFTAIFLETPNERKKAFDKLLKVEEYRIGAFKLGQTSKHIEGQIRETEQNIARAEGELTNLEKLQKELKEHSKSAKEYTASLSKLAKAVGKQESSLKKLEENKKKYDESKAIQDQFIQKANRLELVAKQHAKDLLAAKEASAAVAETTAARDVFLKAVGMVKELERERLERDKLQTEMGKVETALASVNASHKSIKEQLDEIEKQRVVLSELEPKAKQQTKLEAERKTLEQSIQNLKQKAVEAAGLETQLENLRENHRANEAEIKTIQTFEALAKRAPEIQKRAGYITNELASARARIERDREFQRQVSDGLCPILSAKCLNIKEDQTLDGFLNDRFADLESLIKRLENESKEIDLESKKAHEAINKVSSLAVFEKRKVEIVADGKTAREKHDRLATELKALSNEESRLKELADALSKLGDPAGRVEHMRKDLERIRELREQRSNVESNIERLESERRLKVSQLDVYKDLDSNWKEFTDKRDENAEANNRFIKNETLAKKLPEIEKLSEETGKELEKVLALLKSAKSDVERAAVSFDAEKYGLESAALRETELELATVRTQADFASERKKKVESEIENLNTTKIRLSEDKKEKERLEKLSQTVSFIRNTLKSAAPRVAKNYVFHVSVEANTLYREITGNAEATLRWMDDYGIELEQDGYGRPFLSLSGGEQMSAALAVRLALLRQLSEIRIAFFDEPTTNMDLERRERLAEQISRITENQTFDQLFVISHDDTFESYVDHVLAIGE